MVMEDQPFPVAHMRPCLDDQFSFRSDEPLADYADRDEAIDSDVQAVVESEKWFHVSCQSYIPRVFSSICFFGLGTTPHD